MPYNQNYRNGGDRRFESKENTPAPVIIQTFYKTDNKTVLSDLFDKTAVSVAESFIGIDRNGSKIKITTSQLRRIFDEVKRIERILTVSPDQWEAQYPYIKMIKSKVAYQVARVSDEKGKFAEAKLYINFEKFICSCIDLVDNREKYSVFVALFESVYGFYYEMITRNIK